MSAATLNGHRVTSARATIPAWGCWYADVQVDGEVTLTGRVTLQMADLALSGTVLSGGPAKGRSSYRLVAGGGGWGRTIKAWSYADDAGVKQAKVIGDAAREAGETVADLSTSERIGPNWTRDKGPASATLHRLAPSAWYVDEAGVTRLGARAPGVLVGKVTRVTDLDRARGKVVLAAESIATILPGVVVDGMTAVDVLHEISADGGLRSTVWGAQSMGPLESMRKIVEALDPDRKFRGPTEYIVDTLSGSRVNLTPARASAGMPEIKLATVRPGVAGCEATLALGARVLVGFIDADQSRPYVAGFEDADGTGFVPTMLKLCGGADFVALSSKVDDSFGAIKAAFAAWTPVPNDGGAALKTAWTGNVSGIVPTSASKVKAT